MKCIESHHSEQEVKPSRLGPAKENLLGNQSVSGSWMGILPCTFSICSCVYDSGVDNLGTSCLRALGVGHTQTSTRPDQFFSLNLKFQWQLSPTYSLAQQQRREEWG